jgi:CGNR zinc finger
VARIHAPRVVPAACDPGVSGLVPYFDFVSGCRWLFLDASQNRSRHWCSMEVCGTNAKKRRYVERRRAAQN